MQAKLWGTACEAGFYEDPRRNVSIESPSKMTLVNNITVASRSESDSERCLPTLQGLRAVVGSDLRRVIDHIVSVPESS